MCTRTVLIILYVCTFRMIYITYLSLQYYTLLLLYFQRGVSI